MNFKTSPQKRAFFEQQTDLFFLDRIEESLYSCSKKEGNDYELGTKNCPGASCKMAFLYLVCVECAGASVLLFGQEYLKQSFGGQRTCPSFADGLLDLDGFADSAFA
jgi:hypothetical protein